MNSNKFSFKPILFLLVILTLVLSACQPAEPVQQEAISTDEPGTMMEDKHAAM